MRNAINEFMNWKLTIYPGRVLLLMASVLAIGYLIYWTWRWWADKRTIVADPQPQPAWEPRKTRWVKETPIHTFGNDPQQEAFEALCGCEFSREDRTHVLTEVFGGVVRASLSSDATMSWQIRFDLSELNIRVEQVPAEHREDMLEYVRGYLNTAANIIEGRLEENPDFAEHIETLRRIASEVRIIEVTPN